MQLPPPSSAWQTILNLMTYPIIRKMKTGLNSKEDSLILCLRKTLIHKLTEKWTMLFSYCYYKNGVYWNFRKADACLLLQLKLCEQTTTPRQRMKAYVQTPETLMLILLTQNKAAGRTMIAPKYRMANMWWLSIILSVSNWWALRNENNHYTMRKLGST